MNTKKSIAAAVVAVGMTVTVAGSPAQSSPDSETAVAKAEQTVLAAHKTLEKARSSADNARTGDDSARCGKRAASMKETKRLWAYMPYKKAKRILGSKGRKVGSKSLRAWNTCYDTSDLYLHMAKRKGKFYVYDVSAPIL